MDRDRRFESMYERHEPDVLAYFLRRLGREDAVEAAADVFLTAWRRIDDVPRPDDEARRWLFGVAHNMLSNRRRSSRRFRRLVARLGSMNRSDPDPLPEAVVVRRAQDQEVIGALARLRPMDREVLRLRLWEEASFDDIGKLVGCTRHAAEQRYAKALRRFGSEWSRSGHVSTNGTNPSQYIQERTREA